MSEPNSENSAGENKDDRREVAWNEFDWERYLREQDDAVHRYLGFYEACKTSPDRIDDVAELMDWGMSDDDEPEEFGGPNDGAKISGGDNADDDDSDDDDEVYEDDEVYTLHKNPIFVSTKALFLSLRRTWELLAADGTKAPQPLAVALLTALHRAEEQAVQAVNALDFGDYAMAVSLFKRALAALNAILALLNDESIALQRAVLAWRAEALPKIFDLREIWLRVVGECREELGRPTKEN